MWEALQAHAASRPGEPFDHERHMPDCMRAARDDPATWASGAAISAGGGSGNSDGHLVRRAAPPARSDVHD